MVSLSFSVTLFLFTNNETVGSVCHIFMIPLHCKAFHTVEIEHFVISYFPLTKAKNRVENYLPKSPCQKNRTHIVSC